MRFHTDLLFLPIYSICNLDITGFTWLFMNHVYSNCPNLMHQTHTFWSTGSPIFSIGFFNYCWDSQTQKKSLYLQRSLNPVVCTSWVRYFFWYSHSVILYPNLDPFKSERGFLPDKISVIHENWDCPDAKSHPTSRDALEAVSAALLSSIL